jgi:hypothetical protein
MRVFPLRTYDLPDVGDHLIHFTGRRGPKFSVGQNIMEQPAQERLLQILVGGVIHGFETFGSGAPVACFSESTKPAVTKLIREGRYEPCGIGFSKQRIFDSNGGPALYVRGDEWQTMTEVLPHPLRSRLVRFWPGAETDPDDRSADHLRTPSQWLHEREWRIPGDFRFDWVDVEFLLVPHLGWQAFYADWIESWAGEEYAAIFQGIRAVVIDDAGHVLRDDSEIWS